MVSIRSGNKPKEDCSSSLDFSIARFKWQQQKFGVGLLAIILLGRGVWGMNMQTELIHTFNKWG